MTAAIEYRINAAISADQFIDLLHRSTLAERRPVDDRSCMEGVVANSNLMVTAWAGDTLIGVSRALTDFHYACYVSDLAVDTAYQRGGVGRELLRLTQAQLGPRCNLILVAAPAANDYYGHIGFSNNPRCWVLGRDQAVRE